jgi:hypothetical protein
MNQSTTVKRQRKTFRTDYVVNGNPETLIATVRYDDDCGNGHNTFAITGEVYTKGGCRRDGKTTHATGKVLYWSSGGCIHDDIAKRLPDLAPLIKWHLVSADGPLHYIANTVYFAGNRDYNGLRKGEFRPFLQDGVPMWTLPHEDTKVSADKPQAIEWELWGRTGEGKSRELVTARHSAVWPDATDDDLTAEGLEDRLADRLPVLLDEFKAAIESLGFQY